MSPDLAGTFYFTTFGETKITMAKALKYHFYLRDKQSNVPTPINFVFRKGAFKRKIGIGESIPPMWWDSKAECAIIDSRQTMSERLLANRVNKNLQRLRNALDELFEKYNSVEKLSPNHTEGEDILYSIYKEASSIIEGSISQETEAARLSRLTPIDFFKQFIDEWSRKPNRRTGKIPGKGTVWNYQNTLRRYRDYIQDSGLRDSFQLFDADFIDKFDTYLQCEQDLQWNTIVSTHSQLKTMLTAAHNKGLIHNLDFKSWPSKPAAIHHIALKDEEIKRILNVKFTKKLRAENKIGKESCIEESRDLFIICCRTGLRFSDLSHLNQETWDLEGKMLETTIQKTSQKLSIPLHDDVIAIYNKYNGVLPNVVDKSHFNEHIRLCAKLAGINQPVSTFKWEKGNFIHVSCEKWQMISSHTGRRSFATNLFMVSGEAEMVRALTGHKTEDNFRRYICTSQKELAEKAKAYINLEKPNANTNPELIETIQKDAVEKQRLKERLQKEQRSTLSQTQMTAIAEFDRDHLASQMEEMMDIWSRGLTLEEYNRFKQRQDEISTYVDSLPTQS